MSEKKSFSLRLDVVEFFTMKNHMPKICVPLVGRNRDELLGEITEVNLSEADLVEWRADFYLDRIDMDALIEMLNTLRTKTHLPILFTFRTKAEGGEKEIADATYLELLTRIAGEEKAQCIDVEVNRLEPVVQSIIDEVHKKQQIVIASNHEFHTTPDSEELIRRMVRMDQLGADVLKIACMPKTMSDVVEVLKATTQMREKYTEKPIITMSMGELGTVSRYTGELFGSALTFGALREVSAPGQLHCKELKEILLHIHRLQTRSSS